MPHSHITCCASKVGNSKGSLFISGEFKGHHKGVKYSLNSRPPLTRTSGALYTKSTQPRGTTDLSQALRKIAESLTNILSTIYMSLYEPDPASKA